MTPPLPSPSPSTTASGSPTPSTTPLPPPAPKPPPPSTTSPSPPTPTTSSSPDSAPSEPSSPPSPPPKPPTNSAPPPSWPSAPSPSSPPRSEFWGAVLVRFNAAHHREIESPPKFALFIPIPPFATSGGLSVPPCLCVRAPTSLPFLPLVLGCLCGLRELCVRQITQMHLFFRPPFSLAPHPSPCHSSRTFDVPIV